MATQHTGVDIIESWQIGIFTKKYPRKFKKFHLFRDVISTHCQGKTQVHWWLDYSIPYKPIIKVGVKSNFEPIDIPYPICYAMWYLFGVF